jgi:arylsulfatase A-like enzyme
VSDRPNIVLIMADDLGFSDLGCYGGEIETPNLDRLATNGLRFTQFYTNAKCAPSRASLLTGLYPAQVTEGGRGNQLHSRNNVTLAEVLGQAGYRTLAAGKWHNGGSDERRPCARGFERFWGLISGCSNYFNPGDRRDGEPEPGRKEPGDARPWCDHDTIMKPFAPSDPDFYTTDAFTDHAIQFLDECGGGEDPFFLYLPHCAPHFPLQAWPEDIEKYRARYKAGWVEIRRRRYERLLELGLVEPRWGLSAADERSDDSYANLGEHAAEAMAVYAAMVDRLDQSVGRVLDKIRSLGKEENTLVLFLTDNGGCAEEIHNTPHVPPGGVDSYQTVGAAWANASNTPFRLFKDFDHEGGISTPLIASWPARIRSSRTVHDVGHLVDFMPTFAELAGVDVPATFQGRDVLPAEGQSLAGLLGEEATTPVSRELYWIIGGARAMRQGKWKLVTEGPERVQAGIPVPAGHESWGLYDMEADRCELYNLADRHPDRVRTMSSMWEAWRERTLADTGV